MKKELMQAAAELWRENFHRRLLLAVAVATVAAGIWKFWPDHGPIVTERQQAVEAATAGF